MKKRLERDRKKFNETLNYLKTKERILFLTTSNRWIGQHEIPKSTQLAFLMKKKLGKKVRMINVPGLKIYMCEGNVSIATGNNCGVAKALLKNKFKNPSGFHKCWASINNKDDELWRISKELFKSDCIVFFGSVRWGQANAVYQRLIERLTWIENHRSTLGEGNLVGNIDAGIILVGQNWNGRDVIRIQKGVFESFGFKVIEKLCWNWQYTKNIYDERDESYIKGVKTFRKTFIER
ncbi:hypothetical protein HYT25_01120 [Candidatus Pacearchaeota archaeon]|nr:hypothetical protein [Candidatus Pacearchaeota archaeon]